jgi:benzoate membrane transport protein
MDLKRTLADFNAEAFWAGISTFAFMVFGALTLQLSIIERFNLPQPMAQSWIVVTWLTPGVVSLLFILRFRQPLGIGWTIPGLVYLGSLAGKFSFEEMVTANLIAGCAIVLLGFVGAGRHLIRLVPMPILMSMFAASMIDFIVRLVDAAAINVALTAPMIGAYLFGRRLNCRQVPPIGLSVITGAVLIAILGQSRTAAVDFGLPTLATPGIAFSLEAILTISIPMVVLVTALGNGQGLGFLVAQGYRVPANSLTIAIGLMTMVNAVFGGHPAAMTRTSSAMLGGPAAGPLDKRYWAAAVAFTMVLAVSVGSGLFVTLVTVVPPEYILVIAGLAVLPSFEDALLRAFDGQLRFGSVVAFGMTLSSSLTLAGIPSAFWALPAGVAASLLIEGDELRAYWGRATSSAPSTQDAMNSRRTGIDSSYQLDPTISVIKAVNLRNQ